MKKKIKKIQLTDKLLKTPFTNLWRKARKKFSRRVIATPNRNETMLYRSVRFRIYKFISLSARNPLTPSTILHTHSNVNSVLLERSSLNTRLVVQIIFKYHRLNEFWMYNGKTSTQAHGRPQEFYQKEAW